MTYSAIDYQPGDIVFRQGEPGDSMFIVKDGEVEVIQDLDGNAPKLVATLERGDFFGEMAVLDREPRSHAVRAKTEARLVKVDRTGFSKMLLRNPEIGVRMIRKLARRLHANEEQLSRIWSGVSADLDDTMNAKPKEAKLVALGEHPHEMILPAKNEISLGRHDPIQNVHPDIDLTQVDPQLSTSRRHALIVRRGTGFAVVEERATNGTHVNGSRISGDDPHPLNDGDELLLGAVKMRFVIA
ncbi:MAG: cyclic nucleotide-binding domain-containing protein [Acidobacteriota bacterium]